MYVDEEDQTMIEREPEGKELKTAYSVDQILDKVFSAIVLVSFYEK